MIVEGSVTVPAAVGALAGVQIVRLVVDTASPAARVSAEKNSYLWQGCFVGKGRSLSVIVAAEVEHV